MPEDDSEYPETQDGVLGGPSTASVTAREIEGFRIHGFLGAGGMGVVYEAEQEQPQRPVALKLILGGAAQGAHRLRLFEREIRTLARLQHPGIATIYAAGSTPHGQHYFAMELVRGETLGVSVSRRALATRERLELFLQVCDAVSYAHQRGVVHRDLKPSNILVDAQGRPKVLDFGLAKITDKDMAASLSTEVGRIQGTLQYMSPEQARGNPDEIDVRADVYSLGMILYQLLTDTLPYDVRSVSLMSALQMICEDPPPRPSLARRQLQGDLDVIVLKSLEKQPPLRYASVAALADDVSRYLHDQPISARAPSATYQLRKLVARHRLPFASAAVLLLLIVGAGVWMGVLYARADHNLTRALLAEEKARGEALAATRVADFLAGLFKVSDPGAARGNSVTAREILDRGAAQVRQELKAQPLVQASLMATMGRVYQNMGLFAAARPLLAGSLAAREAQAGDNKLLVAESLNRLAELDYYEAKYADGIPRSQRSLALREQAAGPESLEVADSLYILGSLYNISGDYKAAEAPLRRGLAIREKLLGPEHPDTAEVMNEVASVLESLDGIAEAEGLYRRALATREKALGSDHPDVATSLNNLAGLLTGRKQYDAANALYLRVIALREKVQGPNHPELAIAIYNLGVNLQVQKRYDEAISLYRRALAIFEKALGPEHPNTGHCLNTMGGIETLRGHYKEADGLLQRALALREKALGGDSSLVASSLAELGRLRDQQGRPSDAVPLLTRALAIEEKALGPQHPAVADTLETYASALRKLGRAGEAAPLEDRAKAIRQAHS